ncbi:MAG: hypothetical protein PHX54_06900 [Lentimicrobiaceae bacterium]|nr:hypothetical protein [Lentimicrobiaceae bacterium]
MFKYELYKVVAKKIFWAFLVASLALNILALWWISKPTGLPHAHTKAFYDTIRNMSPEQEIAYVQNQIELMDGYIAKNWLAFNSSENDDEIAVWREAYQTARKKFGSLLDQNIPTEKVAAQKSIYTEFLNSLLEDKHKKFLNEINEKAELLLGSSLFGGSADSFSKRNIEKTRADFANLSDIKTVPDINDGIALLFDTTTTDILLLFIIILICFALITDEKDKRLFLIVKSTPNGTIRTIFAKLGALAVCVIVVNLLMLASNVLFASSVFGLGNLSRSIQSVPDMIGSTMRISVAQFILIYFVVKTAGLFVIGMVIMLISLHTSHSVIMLFVTVITAVTNVVLTFIHAESAWNWFRYLNLAAFMRPYDWLKSYKNLNFFNCPVNLIPVFTLFAVVILIVLCVLVSLSFVKRRALDNNLKLFKFNIRIPILLKYAGYRWYEFKKIAIINKAIVIIAFFVIFQGHGVFNSEAPFLGYEHYYFKYTMQALHGPLTDEKEEYILNEKAKFDEAQRKIKEIEAQFERGEIPFQAVETLSKKYQNILDKKSAFDLVYERYLYLKETKGAQFLYDTGYRLLFGFSNADNGLASGIKMLIVLILCLCGVFAIEYKTEMYKILNSTLHGNIDTVKTKMIISFIISTLIFVSAYMPDLIYIYKYFGLPGLNLPLLSVQPAESSRFPEIMSKMPIWGYLVMLFIVRLAVFFIISLYILTISLIIRNSVFTTLCAFGLFIVPLLIHTFGYTFLDKFSMLHLITANPMFNNLPLWQSFTQCLINIVIAIGCTWLVIRRFGKATLIG